MIKKSKLFLATLLAIALAICPAQAFEDFWHIPQDLEAQKELQQTTTACLTLIQALPVITTSSALTVLIALAVESASYNLLQPEATEEDTAE